MNYIQGQYVCMTIYFIAFYVKYNKIYFYIIFFNVYKYNCVVEYVWRNYC